MLKNSPGDRYGRLVLKEHVASSKKGAVWLCACDCGDNTIIPSGSFRSGNTRSCGCLFSEQARRQAVTHGMSRTGMYRRWCAMIKRCENPRDKAYKHYGARGIEVCKEWRESFEAFLEDVGECPQPGYSLDRINNDGNYEPGNVRWATQSQQVNNSRRWK